MIVLAAINYFRRYLLSQSAFIKDFASNLLTFRVNQLLVIVYNIHREHLQFKACHTP